MSTYQRIGIPDNVINTFLVIALVFLFAPYVGGHDFGIFKDPIFPLEIEK